MAWLCLFGALSCLCVCWWGILPWALTHLLQLSRRCDESIRRRDRDSRSRQPCLGGPLQLGGTQQPCGTLAIRRRYRFSPLLLRWSLWSGEFFANDFVFTGQYLRRTRRYTGFHHPRPTRRWGMTRAGASLRGVPLSNRGRSSLHSTESVRKLSQSVSREVHPSPGLITLQTQPELSDLPTLDITYHNSNSRKCSNYKYPASFPVLILRQQLARRAQSIIHQHAAGDDCLTSRHGAFHICQLRLTGSSGQHPHVGSVLPRKTPKHHADAGLFIHLQHQPRGLRGSTQVFHAARPSRTPAHWIQPKVPSLMPSLIPGCLS